MVRNFWSPGMVGIYGGVQGLPHKYLLLMQATNRHNYQHTLGKYFRIDSWVWTLSKNLGYPFYQDMRDFLIAVTP